MRTVLHLSRAIRYSTNIAFSQARNPIQYTLGSTSSLQKMSTSFTSPENPQVPKDTKDAESQTQSQDTPQAPCQSTSSTASTETPLPLPLPSTSQEGVPSLDISQDQTLKLDHLGPLVVNKDGSLSKIANWEKMAEIERQNTLRVLGKRNQLRLEALRKEGGSEEGK